MTVKELIAELKEISNQNLELISSKDDEGNGYNHLRYSPEIRYYLKDQEDYIEHAYDEEEMQEAIDEGEYKKKDFVKCVLV